MVSRIHLLVLVSLLAFAIPAQAREGFASVVWRNMDVALESEAGERRDVRFRRIGIEYWEGVASGVQVGFTLGYSENEARGEGDAGIRPVETIPGNFGSLGMRYQVPLRDRLSIEGGADYLLQRDVRDLATLEVSTRSWETRVEAALVWRTRHLVTGLGASWRDIDFRETRRDSDAEAVRRSGNVDNAAAHAMLGVNTDASGSIAFRYEAGAEAGWSLHFTRRF